MTIEFPELHNEDIALIHKELVRVKNTVSANYPDMSFEGCVGSSVSFGYPLYWEGHSSTFGKTRTLCYSRKSSIFANHFPLPDNFEDAGKIYKLWKD